MKKLSSKPDVAGLERRRKSYADYLALCHFEGIEFTDEMKADAERLLNGEMTPEQYTAFVTAKYREIARRRAALTQTRASFALEGLTLSPDTLADMERYVAGELTHDELMARLDAKYRQ